jgi:hypothetical protein
MANRLPGTHHLSMTRSTVLGAPPASPALSGHPQPADLHRCAAVVMEAAGAMRLAGGSFADRLSEP